MLLNSLRDESILAQLDHVVARRHVGETESSIRLHRSHGRLIDEDLRARRPALDGERGKVRNRLEVEGQLGLFSLADANLLWRKILKAWLADGNHVILWLKIWNSQLSTLRGSL